MSRLVTISVATTIFLALSFAAPCKQPPLEDYVKPEPRPIEVSEKRIASRGYAERTIVVQATAYTHTGYRTYSGVWPEDGRTVAACLDTFEVGTALWIEGVGYRVVEDKIPPGSVALGAKLDIFMDRKEDCRQWGRRDVKVIVVEGVEGGDR